MTTTETLDLLALAHAVIDAGWCQIYAHETRAGSPVHVASPRAVRHCLVGAVDSAAWNLGLARESDAVFDLLQAALSSDAVTIISFNDASQRRKRDVLRLIERAASKVGKG